MRLEKLQKKLLENPAYRKAFAQEDLIHRVGERVRIIRGGKGMTQAGLAEKADLTQPRVSEIEAGEANVTLRTLATIGFALECRAEDFITRELPGIRHCERYEEFKFDLDSLAGFNLSLDSFSEEGELELQGANDNFGKAA